MKTQFKRTLSQILIFLSANLGPLGVKTGFCYPFFYCNSCPAATSACPLRALEVGVFQNSFKWKLILFPLLIIGFFGVLTGRAICGWACPIGLLQRATAPVAQNLKKIPITKKFALLPIEPKLRYIKYIMLIGLVFFTPLSLVLCSLISARLVFLLELFQPYFCILLNLCLTLCSFILHLSSSFYFSFLSLP